MTNVHNIHQKFKCYYDFQCYINFSAPFTFVQCINGSCSCKDCFELGKDGLCRVSKCYSYNNITRSCADERKSQLIAFLLSLFLSGVGAANFYINQYGLATAQVLLFSPIILTCCGMICTSFRKSNNSANGDKEEVINITNYY